MNKRLICEDEQQKERINENPLKGMSELLFSRITRLCDWMQLFFYADAGSFFVMYQVTGMSNNKNKTYKMDPGNFPWPLTVCITLCVL